MKPLPTWAAIRQLRKDEELTQEQLAKKAGISVQYVRMIEAGHQKMSKDVKCRLADALNISVWALFPEVKREVDYYELLKKVHGADLVIRDNEVAMFKEVLSRMHPDEFGLLVESGVSPEDVHREIRKWAKENNIEVVK